MYVYECTSICSSLAGIHTYIHTHIHIHTRMQPGRPCYCLIRWWNNEEQSLIHTNTQIYIYTHIHIYTHICSLEGLSDDAIASYVGGVRKNKVSYIHRYRYIYTHNLYIYIYTHTYTYTHVFSLEGLSDHAIASYVGGATKNRV